MRGVYDDLKPFVVTMTSYPDRIKTIWVTIMSLVNQDVEPQKIVLFLSKDQFPNERNDLPNKLIDIEKKYRFEIRFVEEDIKSFKKFYYCLGDDRDDFMTVDDDVFYPNKLTSWIWDLHERYPEDIIATAGREIEDFYSLPSKWRGDLNKKLEHIPAFRIIGIGGVYYPQGCLYKDASNLELAKSICPWADDLWLTMMSRLKGTYYCKYFTHCNPITIWGSQKTALSSAKNVNAEVTRGITNDEQWKRLLEYYGEELKMI